MNFRIPAFAFVLWSITVYASQGASYPLPAPLPSACEQYMIQADELAAYKNYIGTRTACQQAYSLFSFPNPKLGEARCDVALGDYED